MLRYVRMAKTAYERLKKVDPNCVVAGLTMCKEYRYTPPYKIARRILPELKDHIDMLAPDLYCGSSELGKVAVPCPEDARLRQWLLDTQDLQASFGKGRSIAIGEKGYAVPYHVPPDHTFEKAQANFTARALIIARSVPQVRFYGHYECLAYVPWKMKEKGWISDDTHPVMDFGIWKEMIDAKGSGYCRPRCAVAAFSTVARMLANVTDPVELNVRPGFYSVLFTKRDHAVAAVWITENTPRIVRIELPTVVGCCDLMGNTRSLPAGPADLAVSESPVFLTCEAAPKLLAGVIQKTVFP